MSAAVTVQNTLPPTSMATVNATSEGSTLLHLHDSLLQDILRRTDIQSRVAASMACQRLARVSAEHPPSAVDLSSDGVHPEACRRYIERAKGSIIALTTARQQHHTACAAASARRFSTGVRCTQVVPYTTGPAAGRLAACLPRLQHLALHEATSCLGGMTDEFAAAVAAHCPHLTSLEVAFTRYSLPSEFFTDAGMMALAAGCPRLSALSLTNCGAITDRSLYAVAVHCRGLRRLALGGYHELISDYGTVVLFQACTGLERVALSGKLRRVTDESVEPLAAHSGATLQEVKLTRSMGDRSLESLAAHCTALRLVDCCKCESGAVTAEGVAALVQALVAGHHQPQQQQQPQEQPAAAAAMAGHAATDGGGSGEVGSAAPPPPTPPAVLRMILPRGVAAADVVRLRPGSDGGGTRWRAVSVAPSPILMTGGGGSAASASASTTGSPTSFATLLKLGSAAAAAGGGGNIICRAGGGGGSLIARPCGGPPLPCAEQTFEEVLVRL